MKGAISWDKSAYVRAGKQKLISLKTESLALAKARVAKLMVNPLLEETKPGYWNGWENSYAAVAGTDDGGSSFSLREFARPLCPTRRQSVVGRS